MVYGSKYGKSGQLVYLRWYLSLMHNRKASPIICLATSERIETLSMYPKTSGRTILEFPSGL